MDPTAMYGSVVSACQLLRPMVLPRRSPCVRHRRCGATSSVSRERPLFGWTRVCVDDPTPLRPARTAPLTNFRKSTLKQLGGATLVRRHELQSHCRAGFDGLFSEGELAVVEHIYKFLACPIFGKPKDIGGDGFAYPVKGALRFIHHYSHEGLLISRHTGTVTCQACGGYR